MSESTRREFIGASLGTVAAASGLSAGDVGSRIDTYRKLVGSEAHLVAYWPFEGDLADQKGRAAGSSPGDAKYTDGPAGGKALLLEQGRLATMGACPHLDLPATSVELLFKLTRPITARYNPCLIAKRTGHVETRFSIHVMRDDLTLAVWNGQRVYRFRPPYGALEIGKWYHLVLVWEKNRMHVYVDGMRCGGGGGTLNVKMTGLPLNIGSSTPKGHELCDCAVDEVAIYDRVLSEDDIVRHVEAIGFGDRRKQLAEQRRRRQAERLRRDEKAFSQLLTSERLTAAGRQRVYRDKHLSAISLPVGGIGSGLIQMDGHAQLKVWQIFSNFIHMQVPHSFLAVRAKKADGEAVMRALQTKPINPLPAKAADPFPAMKSLSFRGEYPFGWYDFEDPSLPVRVSLEAFNPLIPLNAKDSSLPCVLLNLTAKNATDQPVAVSFLASLQNAVGYGGGRPIQGRSYVDYGGNSNRVVHQEDATIVHMTSARDKKSLRFGDMTLVAFESKAEATAGWQTLDALKDDLAEDGNVTGPETAGPSPAGETIDAAVAVPFTLGPGQSRTVRFALTWFFPNARHGGGSGWVHEGQMYANWFSSALDVAGYLRQNIDELTRLTRLYHETVYRSNLPRWLLDRITSQVAVLRSKTCFWAGDGFFGGWEGCNAGSGCCYGNCAHVWHYAQAHARLFPPIARRMREQAFAAQQADGGIPFRLPKHGQACDGQCGEVLEAWREHLCSRDGQWLKQHWPNVKKAIDYVIARWDKDEDGVFSGPQHNTLDGELGGNSSWLGTMYLSALAAAEKMAELNGDRAAAGRYRRIRLSGTEKQNAALWNGEYYIQIPDPEPHQDYGEGCHIDQVLGEWWAGQVNLDGHYPAERVRTALKSLVHYNFRGDFHDVPQLPRKFVDDDDSGLQMICWPDDDRPAGHMRYADEVMTGFEYSAAAAMVHFGLVREGLAVVLATSDRYDGRLRTGLSGENRGYAAWGYSGNPFGDDECGKFYARAMSVWSTLVAAQGFLYDGPAGTIGFEPRWQPEDHASFFTAGEGWGLFTQKREAKRQIHRIEIIHGKLAVRQFVCTLPENETPTGVEVKLAETVIAARLRPDGKRLTVELRRPVTVSTGQTMTLTVQS